MTGMGRRPDAAAPIIPQLLDFHFCAGFFELLLGGIGVSLVRAFQQRLRSAFDQSLRFGQAQSGLHFTHGFDGGDLLVRRNGSENHVKSVLGSRSRSSRATGGSATGSSNRDGRGGGNAPFGFKLFHQVSGFDDRQLAQFFDECLRCLAILLFLSVVSSSASASAIFSPQPANRRFTLLFVCLFLRSAHLRRSENH